MNIIKLKSVYLCLTLIILYYLMNTSECNALMSSDRKEGTETSVIEPDLDRNRNSGVSQAEHEVSVPEVDTAVSKEENTSMETQMKEEVDRIKEEKRRIIEETIKQEEIYPSFPDRMKPYVAEEGSVLSDREKPKEEEIRPLEKYNVIITEKPFLFFIVLLALAMVIYYIYAFTLRRK